MSVDVERVIECVKRYKILYDASHPDFKCIKKKDNAWLEISALMGVNNAEEIKKRWKNLKDCYVKHLRSEFTHTGPTAKILDRYKSWPWAQQMAIFRPFMQYGRVDSNISFFSMSELGEAQSMHSSSSMNGEGDRLSENGHLFGSTKQDGMMSPSHQIATLHGQPANEIMQLCANEEYRHLSNTAEIINQERKQYNETFSQPSALDKILAYLRKEQNCDDIDHLFRGYAKTVKKFAPRRQALIKYKIAKIIMEEELQHQDNTSELVLNISSPPEREDRLHAMTENMKTSKKRKCKNEH